MQHEPKLDQVKFHENIILRFNIREKIILLRFHIRGAPCPDQEALYASRTAAAMPDTHGACMGRGEQQARSATQGGAAAAHSHATPLGTASEGRCCGMRGPR